MSCLLSCQVEKKQYESHSLIQEKSTSLGYPLIYCSDVQLWELFCKRKPSRTFHLTIPFAQETEMLSRLDREPCEATKRDFSYFLLLLLFNEFSFPSLPLPKPLSLFERGQQFRTVDGIGEALQSFYTQQISHQSYDLNRDERAHHNISDATSQSSTHNFHFQYLFHMERICFASMYELQELQELIKFSCSSSCAL